MMDGKVIEHLRSQIAFSVATFGPGTRINGVLDHISKEIEEVRAEPSLEEWIDIVILAMDGAWRHVTFSKEGEGPAENSATTAANLVATALHRKLDRNFFRTWPNWRDQPRDRAIEHDRSDEVSVHPVGKGEW